MIIDVENCFVKIANLGIWGTFVLNEKKIFEKIE